MYAVQAKTKKKIIHTHTTRLGIHNLMIILKLTDCNFKELYVVCEYTGAEILAGTLLVYY